MAERPRVVIIGGGFGGLYAARALRRAPIELTIVDRRNHHLFQPLLYQVATAGLSAPQIAAPIRRILRRQRNARVLLAEATRIDSAGKCVELEGRDALPYDYLVVATGATHAYLGHDEWARHAPGLKSIEDAFEIRRRIFIAFEAAERARDPAERAEWLTFIVVGGGATGVELAGALAEISRHTLIEDFREIDPSKARIILVEGADRVLPPFPADLSEKARAQLVNLGVEVHTKSFVTSLDDRGVMIGGDRIAARTVLWAAGVAASPLGKTLGAPLDRAGRVKVEADLSLPGHPEVFVIGDLAAVEQDGGIVPGVAPAAMQEGRHAAMNVMRRLRGEPAQPFRYDDKGMLATIGRSAAVGTIRRFHLSGFVAWLAWLLIHVYFLIGFRNRYFVLIDWAWSYLSYHRSARLIFTSRL